MACRARGESLQREIYIWQAVKWLADTRPSSLAACQSIIEDGRTSALPSWAVAAAAAAPGPARLRRGPSVRRGRCQRSVPAHREPSRVEGAQAPGARAPADDADPLRGGPPRRSLELLPGPAELLGHSPLLPEHAPRRARLGRHRLPLPRRRGRKRVRGPGLGPRRGPRARLQRPGHRHLPDRQLCRFPAERGRAAGPALAHQLRRRPRQASRGLQRHRAPAGPQHRVPRTGPLRVRAADAPLDRQPDARAAQLQLRLARLCSCTHCSSSARIDCLFFFFEYL